KENQKTTAPTPPIVPTPLKEPMIKDPNTKEPAGV
ncbi:flagellar protein, partial [Staphylococcus pseudintermedius]